MASNILIFLSLITIITCQEDLIPTSTLPTPSDPFTTFIPILTTNDLHGTFYPLEVPAQNNLSYKSGGLEYLGKYISIMRSEWGDKFFWVDSGDQFQGGLETKLSDGQIMSDFYNTMQVAACAVGNHEFDFGQEYLASRLLKADYNYYAANIKLNEGSNPGLSLINKSFIKEIEGIKIGVIGLATIETETTTSGDLTGIQFEEYAGIVLNEAERLRNEEQVNAVVLLCHMGPVCSGDADRNKVGIRNSQSVQGSCKPGEEIPKLLSSLPKGTIDAVLAGHKHEIVHHWINDVPVASNPKNGETISIVYLAFDKITRALQKDKIQIEGPWPVCEKVFPATDNTFNCKIANNKDASTMISYKFHGTLIEKEEVLKDIAKKYIDSINDYKTVITTTNKLLEISHNKETELGNLFCDIIQRVTGADMTVINAGALRRIWPAGDITKMLIYEMSPFDNDILTVEMTGAEINRMMYELQMGSKGFYPTTGLKQVVRDNPHELISFKMFDGVYERDIDPLKTYTVGSIVFDFIQGGDDFSKILRWYSPRNIVMYGELRDHTEKVLGATDLIDVDMLYDAENPRMRIIN